MLKKLPKRIFARKMQGFNIDEIDPCSLLDHFSCTAQCRPGTYSSDGLERCVTCPKGSFSSASGSLSCSTCPAGTLTTRRGATSLKDCQSKSL